jgi:hypothetical protein
MDDVSVYVRRPGVVERYVENSTILTYAKHPDFIALSVFGTHVWAGLRTPRSPRELAAAIGPIEGATPERVADEIQACLAELVERGVVVTGY